MKNKLDIENLKRLFESIDKIGLSLEEIVSLVRENIGQIAKDISMGRFAIAFYSPSTPIEKEGRRAFVELYQDMNGYSAEDVVYEFPAGNGGVTTFTANSAAGCVWNEEDKKNVLFLCRLIFVICGRSRLSDLIDKTISRDVYTGLPNANGFIVAGNRFISQKVLHNYLAMYVNLKNFKYVNNRVGNKDGDLVIRAYVNEVSKALEADEVMARLGGDNFTFLIKKNRKEEFISLLSGVSVEVECEGELSRFVIEARIGIYDIEKDDNMPHVMNCISSAISTAKRNDTGDVVIFNQEIINKIAREEKMGAGFAGAIANHEFLVYYQPKVNLANRQLCGGEALVRWQLGDRLVMPGEFIPVFERDGKVCALDFYMLEHACEDIKEWLSKGIEPARISVNFSKRHLHDPDIAEKILAVIRKSGIDTKYIEIELTEMSDYSDYDAFKALVAAMKNNGICTSIDDFGTGYSSLNLLSDFMFDVVKLDKSFIDNIDKSESKTDEIVIRNIVNMVNELNMSVIAEGVETVEQEEVLRKIGCTMVQGFLFDKPLCKCEFEKRLVNRNY